jgi:hypothetical protein
MQEVLRGLRSAGALKVVFGELEYDALVLGYFEA